MVNVQVVLVQTCEQCGHDLEPTGVYDPDTLAREALCSIYGEDHFTQWIEPEVTDAEESPYPADL